MTIADGIDAGRCVDRAAASAHLFHKRATILRLTQSYLVTNPRDALGRVAIDIRLRSLDREIRRLEQHRSPDVGLADVRRQGWDFGPCPPLSGVRTVGSSR